MTKFLNAIGIPPGLLPGYALGCAFLALSALFAADIAPHPNVALTMALAGLAGAVGWILGMAASPTGKNEEALFSRATGAVATFVGGFTAGKYMDALDSILKIPTQWPDYVWGRLTLVLLWFAIGFLFTMPPRLARIRDAQALIAASAMRGSDDCRPETTERM